MLCSPRQHGDLPPAPVSHLQRHYRLLYHGRDSLYNVLPRNADIPAPCQPAWGFLRSSVYHHMAAGLQICPDGAGWRVNSAVQWSPQGKGKQQQQQEQVPCRQEGIASEELDLHHSAHAVSEHDLRVVPQSEGRIQGK